MRAPRKLLFGRRSPGRPRRRSRSRVGSSDVPLALLNSVKLAQFHGLRTRCRRVHLAANSSPATSPGRPSSIRVSPCTTADEGRQQLGRDSRDPLLRAAVRAGGDGRARGAVARASFFSLVGSTADEYIVVVERLSDQLRLAERGGRHAARARQRRARVLHDVLGVQGGARRRRRRLLLGGGMFITSVVLGAVAVIAPFSPHRRPFMRDALVYLLGVVPRLGVPRRQDHDGRGVGDGRALRRLRLRRLRPRGVPKPPQAARDGTEGRPPPAPPPLNRRPAAAATLSRRGSLTQMLRLDDFAGKMNLHRHIRQQLASARRGSRSPRARAAAARRALVDGAGGARAQRQRRRCRWWPTPVALTAVVPTAVTAAARRRGRSRCPWYSCMAPRRTCARSSRARRRRRWRRRRRRAAAVALAEAQAAAGGGGGVRVSPLVAAGAIGGPSDAAVSSSGGGDERGAARGARRRSRRSRSCRRCGCRGRSRS